MTDHSAPLNYAEARIYSDALTLVSALRAGVSKPEIAGMIRQAESPHQAITLQLVEWVAGLSQEVATLQGNDPAEAFAEWSSIVYGAIAQFEANAAARDAEGGDPS